MLRIAIQAKGRLSEDSLALLREAGIQVDDTKRKFLSQSRNFPAELLFLRDDDIPQAVALGVADLGIVGYNEVLEREQDVEIVDRLGFGPCRISLAIPKNEEYNGLEWFNGKRIATSYPNILGKFLKEKGIDAKISVITGSVEIAPTVGMSDAIFDIVSSGGTLVSNGLKEVEKIVFSEAVVVANKNLDEDKKKVWEQIKFRFNAVRDSRNMKYLLMNVPDERIEDAIRIIPAMRSPTILPLAQSGWSSMHSVVAEDVLWEKIEALKGIGAEGILVLSVEKMVL
ncbi:MAG: ATP phosphoribosyltransferase [Bacteroidales bacterium]|nr:ATP phosphoribosyltransferase [Candidatus Cryptobacteroides faecihippi]MCQ2163437.1 ATP phosphoribosyltransferase [Bacteroidales bacterium]